MKLVVGCGYLGLRVARRWLAEGHAVAVVTRDVQRAEELGHEGLQAIVADVCRFRLPGGTFEVPSGRRNLLTVLYSIGYDRRSGQSRWEVYVDGLRNVLDALAAPPERFIFISSTGVYGEDAGGWVDEESPCDPTRESGRALLAAEQVLQAHPIGRRAIILRLAGIYGPGRLRHVDLRVEENGPGGVSPYMNLIHVDDAASVVLAAEARAVPPRTYVVSDGHPVDRREFLAFLANLPGDRGAGLQRAETQGRLEESSNDAGGRGASSGFGKRVNNGRMMRELGVELRYPTYREGLAGEG